MKKLLFCLFLLSCVQVLWAQSLEFQDLHTARLQKQGLGMLVLGGWAVGNMAVGAAFLGQSKGEYRAFHQMQIGWGAVNLGIATLGYLGSLKVDPSTWDTYQSVQEHYKIQKILLFNAGLDVGYMLGGAYLLERGKREVKNADRLRGFGRSIILQGAFLFVFDLSLYTVLSSDNSKLKPLLTQSSIGFTPNQVHLRFNFQ